jgi:hypothetical protein
LKRLAGCIDRGLQAVAADQEPVREQVEEIRRIAATLEPSGGGQEPFVQLQERLASSTDPARQRMAVVMAAWLVGLFAGGDLKEVPTDNLELERWFRLPKGHERRIHGHRHAGVRIVQEGATLMLVLDAHQSHPGPFGVSDLLGYRQAQPPPAEQEALRRRKVMRKARSKKKRTALLKELERRYLNS